MSVAEVLELAGQSQELEPAGGTNLYRQPGGRTSTGNATNIGRHTNIQDHCRHNFVVGDIQTTLVNLTTFIMLKCDV
jgi:hypothetical protein